MFYETKNSLEAELWKTESGTNFSFPLHFHGSFEIITVTEGEMQVTVDEKQYDLRRGSLVMVFPNQGHSLQTAEHSKHFLCIFSPRLIQRYSKSLLTKLPKNNMFTPDPFFYELLLSTENKPCNEIALKGLLYSLCASLDESTEYFDKKGDIEGLLEKVFRFVDANYNKDCSLEALSADTSYHYVYLSRYFKRSTGLSFTEYVNRYRINEATYILKNSDKSILQVAYDCGFDSLRSFNRNFKRITGTTPAKYREANS